MPKTDIAKLFQNGRSQAVRLPNEFRFEGDRVRIRRVPQGVLLEPLIPDTARWFEEFIALTPTRFRPVVASQFITPRRKIFSGLPAGYKRLYRPDQRAAIDGSRPACRRRQLRVRTFWSRLSLSSNSGMESQKAQSRISTASASKPFVGPRPRSAL